MNLFSRTWNSLRSLTWCFHPQKNCPSPFPINAIKWKPQIVRAFSNISNYSFFLTIFFKVLATLPFYFKVKLGLLLFGNHRSLCSHHLRALRPRGLWIRMGRKQEIWLLGPVGAQRSKYRWEALESKEHLRVLKCFTFPFHQPNCW